jgi:hypothetical protein
MAALLGGKRQKRFLKRASKRSNAATHRDKNWIASSLTLLAMTLLFSLPPKTTAASARGADEGRVEHRTASRDRDEMWELSNSSGFRTSA